VKLIIIADESHISLETEGPVRGKDGILALLDAARELAEQVTPDPRS
jgi:ribosomal protein S28E/S33